MVKPTTVNLRFDSLTEKKGFFLLYGFSTAALILVFILVMITSIMLYQHFGEGLKHLEFLRKKSKKLGKSSRGGAEGRSFLANSPSLGVGIGGIGGGIESPQEGSDLSGSTTDVFQEIFQNTVWHQQQIQDGGSASSKSGNSAAEIYYETYKQENNFS